ncbi:sialidase family protein [Georgenia halophila]
MNTRPKGVLVPTPCPENHASFLHRLPDERLAVAWFGGSREGRPDVRIYWSVREMGTWGKAEQLSPDTDGSDQNPVLASLPGGELWLLYTSQHLGAQDTARVMRRVSLDNGLTWSEPAALLEKTGVFIRHDLIVLSDGTLLLPAFHCTVLPGRQWHGDADTSVVLRSTDQGRTWDEVEVPASVGAVHMNIVPFEDGGLVAFFRSRWADYVYRSESNDGGQTWTPPSPLDVPNNNSSIQVRAAPEYGPDTLVAALNPVQAPPGSEHGDPARSTDPGKLIAPGETTPIDRHAVWGPPRIPLSLLRSDDRGITWVHVVDFEQAGQVPEEDLRAASDKRKNEMSYPSVIVVGREVHVTYSYNRLAIKHVIVGPETVAK